MLQILKDETGYAVLMNGNDLLSMLPEELKQIAKNYKTFDKNNVLTLSAKKFEDITNYSNFSLLVAITEAKEYVRGK